MNRKWLIVCATILGATIATASYGANITVSWTAPGDDGNVGTAKAYELRYLNSRINDKNWNQATLVANVPLPAPAGSTQSFVITNVDPGRKMYLAMRAVDDAGNWSLISNNAVCANCNCIANRGNVDNDAYDNVTVSDLTELIAYVFGGQSSVPCPLEANVNGDPYESIDVADVNTLVGYLYRDSERYLMAPCQ